MWTFLALENPANRDHIGALGTAAASYSALAVTFKPSEFPNTFPIASSMADQARVLVAAAKRQHLHHIALVRSSSEVAAEGASAFRSAAPKAGLTVTAKTFVVDSRPAHRRRGPTSGPSTPAQSWSSTADRPCLRCSRPVGAPARHARPRFHPGRCFHAGRCFRAGRSGASGRGVEGVQVIVSKSLVVSRRVPAGLATFRKRVLRALHQSRLGGPITPYAQGYDALHLFSSSANGVNASDSASIRTFTENANFEGLLGTYAYTSSDHEGLAASELTVAPLDSLSNGLYVVTASK